MNLDEECSRGIRDAFLDILGQSLLLIRNAADDKDFCHALAYHAHNIPSHISHYKPELLVYYWSVSALISYAIRLLSGRRLYFVRHGQPLRWSITVSNPVPNQALQRMLWDAHVSCIRRSPAHPSASLSLMSLGHIAL
jgi:hypothetical protein